MKTVKVIPPHTFQALMRKALLITLFCCTSYLSVMVQAQKDKWILYPTEVDFNAGPSFPSLNFPSPSPMLAMPYHHENSVHDATGNLLFYYQDGNIFNKKGEWVGSYPLFIGTCGGEAVILPMPGRCQSYYLVTLHTYPLANFSIFMQEITINPDGSFYISDSQYLDGHPVSSPLHGNTGSAGASKIISGTAADRFLYVAVNSMGQVRRYRMSSSGLQFDGIETVFSGDNTYGSELEISPDGQWMAWSVGNTVYLYNFFLLDYNVISIGASNHTINGLEFSLNSQHLAAGVRGQGIALIPVNAPASFSYIPNSANYSHSFIEAGKDGNLYMVNHLNGNLYQLLSDFTTFVATEVAVYSSKGTFMSQAAYVLPDQIDGEGTASFYGIPPVQIQHLRIEQLELPNTISGAIPAFYNCDNIDLQIGYSGQPASYVVKLYSVDPATGQQIFGAPFLNFTKTFVGAPPAAIDLKCLDDPLNCHLFNGYFTQAFAIEITLHGQCSSSTLKGYLRVFDAPNGAADIKLRITPGNGPSLLPSHMPSAPCLAGLYSGGLSLANSNGDITYYRIQMQETNCSTGAVMQNLYNGPPTVVQSVSTLNFGFNSFEINGATGYFILNNFLNRCIRVTAEVGNNCGYVSDFSYVRFNGLYLTGAEESAPPLAQDEWVQPIDAAEVEIAVYPNPTHEYWQFRLKLAATDILGITLLDLAGRTLNYRQMTPGSTDVMLSAAGLAPGVYYYCIQTAAGVLKGKLLKQ